MELRDAATGRRVRPPLRGSAHRHRRWRSRPTAAASPWRTSRATCGCWTWRAARCAGRPRLAGFPTHLSYSPDGGLLAIGLAENGTELRDGRSLRARRPPAQPRRRRRLVGSLLAGRPAAGRHLRRTTRSCGTWPSRRRIGPPLSGPRRLWCSRGVLARRPDARDERIRRQRDPLGRRVAPLARNAPRASRLDVSARFTPDGRRLFVLHELGAAQRWEVSPDAWSRHACRVAGRELTRAEWEELVPDQDYRPVCS